MANYRVEAMRIQFHYQGEDWEISGWATIRDLFVNGITTMVNDVIIREPSIRRTGPPLTQVEGTVPDEESHRGVFEVAAGDYPLGELLRDVPRIEEEDSPMMPESEDPRRKGTKRSRCEESEDEEPLIFPHLKKRHKNPMDLLEESDDEDEQAPMMTTRPVNGWPDEGPSDPEAEVWQEIWIKELEEEHRRVNWKEAKVQASEDEVEDCEDDGLFEEIMRNIIEGKEDVRIEPRMDIDSHVDSCSEGPGGDFRDSLDPFTPLSWEEMMGIHPEKAVEMRERERDYNDWLDRQDGPNEEVEIVDLVSDSESE